MYKYLNNLVSKDTHINYKKLRGKYTYKDGFIGEENSFLINNIPFNVALNMCQKDKLNQETFIWKTDGYFGFIDQNGNSNGEFTKDPRNMGFNKDEVEKFGSRILSKHNDGQGFTFVMEHFVPKYSRGAVGNMAGNNEMICEELFRLDFEEE